MNPKLLLIAVVSLLLCANVQAQKKKKGIIPNRVVCTTGDVKPEDFAPTVYAVDSSADAVYLFDGGKSDFQGNQKGYLGVVYRKHARIRLLHKTAFDDLATVNIPLYVTTGYEMKLDKFSAATYNLENGVVVATKVDKGSFFKDKTGDHINNKFTFPNLKEGSIIEYDYTIIYPDYARLPGWTFQGGYPRLWSEYEATVPEFYDYVMIDQGYQPYVIDTGKVSHDNYNIMDVAGSGSDRTVSFNAAANTVNSVWAMKDVPMLKREGFTSTLENHISKIEFQLSAVRYPNTPARMIMRDWLKVADDLMKDEDYGIALSQGNNWLNDDAKKAMGNTKTPLEKAKHIYEFIRDNYTCTDHDAIYLSQPLKKTYQGKKGNVVDLNMLLAAMLQSQTIEVHPMMLSTTDNGKASEYYPILSKFNYTLCEAKIDGKRYLLDASNPKLGFNHLGPECYNGYGRVIDATLPELINLSADSLREGKITSVFVTSSKDNKISASISSKKGYMESLSLRERLNKSSLPDFFKDIKKSYTGDVEIANEAVDSLNLLDEPVKVNYDLTLDLGDEDVVYFNPMMMEQQKENPFAAAERLYPVEMPYCWDETYVFNMEIPAGFAIEELPKSSRVKLNDDEGMFEYIIAKNGEYIQMRSRVKLEKAIYQPEDYQTLRDFFAFIVKKQAEQIVFKKVK